MKKVHCLFLAGLLVLGAARTHAIEEDRLTVENDSGTTTFRVTSEGNVTAQAFIGDGSQITNLPAGTQGPAGTDGVSIIAASVDANGHLILTLSNDQTIDTGYVIGAQGTEGPAGSPDTQIDILNKIAQQTNGAILTLQQGADENNDDKKFVIKDKLGADKLIATSDGKIGLGIAPGSRFHLSTTESTQDAKGASIFLTTKSISGYSNAGAYFDVTANPDSNSSAEIYGLYGISRSSYGSQKNFNSLIGVRFTAQHRGTGVLNNAIGVNAYPYNGSTGTINNAYGLYSKPWMASGLINNWYGIFIDNKSLGTGAIGELFGVYVKEETAKNFFAGNLGIGTTTPTQKLEVAGGIRINTTAEKPACETSSRGTFWFTQGVSDDVVEACAMIGGVYQWKPLW